MFKSELQLQNSMMNDHSIVLLDDKSFDSRHNLVDMSASASSRGGLYGNTNNHLASEQTIKISPTLKVEESKLDPKT